MMDLNLHCLFQMTYKIIIIFSLTDENFSMSLILNLLNHFMIYLVFSMWRLVGAVLIVLKILLYHKMSK